MNPASQTSTFKARLRRAVDSPLVLGLVIFLLALPPRLLDLAVFVGPDEFFWLTGSTTFAQALVSGDLAKTFYAGHPGVTLMWVETLGAWVRYGLQNLSGQADWAAIVSDDKTMAALGASRMAVGLVNAALAAAMVLLVRPLFGSDVAWVAGFMLAFDPFYLTESRAVRTEALVTNFATLALLAMLLYLKKPALRYIILTAILTGLALLSKISAAALLPVGLLLFAGVPLADKTQAWPPRLRAALINLIVWGGLTAITIVVLWPALWAGPLEVYQQIYEYSAIRVLEGEGGGKSFFLGQTYPEEAPGLLFYPVVLLYRTGPLLWLGLACLVVLMLTGAQTLTRQHKIFVGLITLFLVTYLAVITPSELKFDRYTVPMLPSLITMSALGLVAAWQWLAGRVPKLANLAWLAALLVLIGQLMLAWPHHPYYYTYWNPLLGGPTQAARQLPVGVGGEGLDQAAAFLNTLPQADQLSVASANSQKIRPIFTGTTIALENLDGKWVQADYVLIYISQLQRGKHAEDILAYLARQAPLHTVTLAGLEYAWLYPGPAAQYYGGGHKLEGRGTLFGYDLSATQLTAGETLGVTLYWRNEGQQPGDRFFVRLMDLDGYVWAEGLAQPKPGFEEANRTANAIVESETALSLPVGMPPGDYFFKPGFRTDQGEIIGYFELPGDAKPLKVERADPAAIPTDYRPPQPDHLTIAADLDFLGYALTAQPTSPNPAVWVTLYWQATGPVTHDYVILLRLLDNQQQEIAYWLGRPVRSGYPTTAWQAGQIVQDPWLLTLPPAVSSGVYTLELAVFDAASEAEVSRQPLGQVTLD